jgi:SAM-dependent methyltransferase
MRPRTKRADWATYVQGFHDQRPGITEAVLTRCTSHDQDPYQWLTAGLPPGVVLDLACGNAPTRRHVGPGWIGLDRNRTELRYAAERTIGRAVVGDLVRLPARDGSCDAVICSMALMLVEPLSDALREIRRVLCADGVAHFLLPSRGPLTARDRARYASLGIALRTTTLFPESPLDRDPASYLEQARFEVIADDIRRFAYPIHNHDDANLLVDSLYLPAVTEERRTEAQRLAARWTRHGLGVPFRLITARRGPDPVTGRPR